MPIHRKRFRIEETFNGDMPIPAAVDGDIGPMHREIMTELRAIRAEMASPGRGAAHSWRRRIYLARGRRCSGVA